MNPDHILEQLDGMLRKSEQQRRSASQEDQNTRATAALDEQHSYEEVPRVLLTEAMLTPTASPLPTVSISLEQMMLDDQQVEDLIAEVYADVNAKIESMIAEWIDASLQQRVLKMTSTPHKDPSLSH